MYVVEQNWHAMTWSLGEAYVSRDDAFENLSAKETPQIGRHLLRERSSIVVHRQQNTLDRQGGINSTAKAHERIE